MEQNAGQRSILILLIPIGLASALSAILLTFLDSDEVQPERFYTPQSTSYSVEAIPVTETVEYRFKLNDFHFMTLVYAGGIFDLRPHPGCDINGWGSSWYAQPFLPGATLTHTTISSLTADANGIHIIATGQVSRNLADSYGLWRTVIDFQYLPIEKLILGSGQYTITLLGQLTGTTGDLNLYIIASNYLYNVPLRSGGYGNTGDMKFAEVTGLGISNFIWIPPNQPSYFPTDQTDSLAIDVIGNFNNVDTVALSQTTTPIAPAFKPTLSVTLTSQQPNVGMIFGGVYSLPVSRTFSADNIGITPLILTSSIKTNFSFDVKFASQAIEHCNYFPLVANPD